MKIRLLFVILTGFYFCALNAQTDITLSIEPKQDTIVIGDHVILKVSVVYPKNETILFPEFDAELVPGIGLIEAYAADTLKSKDDRFKHVERKYLITSFDEGNYILDKFPMFRLTASDADTIFSDKQISLVVKTIDIDENFVPYDIKNIKTYPYRWWLWLLLIPVGILLIAGLIVLYLKKRKKPEQIKNKILAYDLAIQKLNKLKKSDLVINRKKEYYTQLTDIIREYIELETGVSVMEKTSVEITTMLPDTIFNSSDIIGNFKDVFEIADFVKFAKYQASMAECETSWTNATEFVTQGNIITNKLKQSENEDSGNSPV